MCPISWTTVSRISRTASPRVRSSAGSGRGRSRSAPAGRDDRRSRSKYGTPAEDPEELVLVGGVRLVVVLLERLLLDDHDDVLEVLAEGRGHAASGLLDVGLELPPGNATRAHEGWLRFARRSSRSKFAVVTPATVSRSAPLDLGQLLRRLDDERRLAGLAAVRHRREIRRVGLDEHRLERQARGGRADVLRRAERDHSGEGHEVTRGRAPSCRTSASLGEGVEDARRSRARRGAASTASISAPLSRLWRIDRAARSRRAQSSIHSRTSICFPRGEWS